VNPATQLPDVTRLWWLYAIVAATFLPAIGFYYVGEEAIFPLSSLEMWYHGEWVEQRFYGVSLKHNPLYNWLIIPLAIIGAGVGVLGQGTAGRNLNLFVIVVGIVRLMLGGGIL